MTQLLERAFAEAAKLTPEQQDELGQWLLAELADEGEWGRRFADTKSALDRLALEALEEHRAGETLDLDISLR